MTLDGCRQNKMHEYTVFVFFLSLHTQREIKIDKSRID